MVRKINWMHYLAIGISTLFVIATSLCSCSRETVYRSFVVKYIYKNQTEFDLQMKVYNSNNTLLKTIDIPKGLEKLTNQTKKPYPEFFYYGDTELDQGDSVVVKFSNNKCITHVKNKSVINNLFNRYKYKRTRISEREYIYNYTFNEIDVTKLKKCN